VSFATPGCLSYPVVLATTGHPGAASSTTSHVALKQYDPNLGFLDGGTGGMAMPNPDLLAYEDEEGTGRGGAGNVDAMGNVDGNVLSSGRRRRS
jgi:hypothetical protein